MFADTVEEVVRDEGDEDAEDDIELKHPGEPTPFLGGSDFRDEEGGRNGGDADAQTTNESRDHERVNIGC